MPDVSRKQQRAMFAAKAGHSTLGIPQKVGAKFAEADEKRGPTKLPESAPKHSAGGKVKKSAVENDTHFVVTGPHGEFHVSKKGLKPETLKELQGMCQGGPVKMSGGGDVDSDDEELAGQPAGDTMAGQPAVKEFFRHYLLDSPFPKKMVPPDTSEADAAASQDQLAQPPPEQPAGPPAIAMPEPPQAVVPKVEGVSPESQEDIDEVKAANLENAGASKKEADATVVAQQDLQDHLQAANKVREDTIAKLTAEGDAIRQGIADNKIDPNHYWTEKGTGGRMMASLGLMLSGLGGGLQRNGSNLALDVIQKNIDRDMKSQVDNLDTQKSLLSDNYKRIGDAQLAWNTTQLYYVHQTQAQLAKLAAGSQSAQVQNNAVIANAGLQLKADQLKTSAANRQAELWANGKNAENSAKFQLGLAGAEAASKAQDAGKIPREVQGKTIGNLNSVMKDVDEHMAHMARNNISGLTGLAKEEVPAFTGLGAEAKAAAGTADILDEKVAAALSGLGASASRMQSAHALIPRPGQGKAVQDANARKLKELLKTQRDEYMAQQGGVGYRVGPAYQSPPPAPAKPNG